MFLLKIYVLNRKNNDYSYCNKNALLRENRMILPFLINLLYNSSQFEVKK
jgi:hypothetical protein